MTFDDASDHRLKLLRLEHREDLPKVHLWWWSFGAAVGEELQAVGVVGDEVGKDFGDLVALSPDNQTLAAKRKTAAAPAECAAFGH